MARCLISFGANLGQPIVTIDQAVQLLKNQLGDRLIRYQLSRMFRTPPVGGPSGQPPFVNAVAALELNNCSAWDVWHVIRQIEHLLGRVRQERWEARRIDLDVLLFDHQRIWTQHFKLPHPRMIMRRFILEPALDVAADWIEPVSQHTLEQLARSLRLGPASLLLLSHDARSDQLLLERAATSAGASWQKPRLLIHPFTEQPTELPTSFSFESRWLGLLPMSDLTAATGFYPPSNLPAIAPANRLLIVPQPKLVCVLAPRVSRPGAAWEDIHRELAIRMELTDDPDRSQWPAAGPRYLLATDDPAWAQHEIIAAMEAMDCPVEPLD